MKTRVGLLLGFCFLVVVCFSCQDRVAKTQQQPRVNIIWLVAEDQSPNFFPMYGDSTISLPNLESLAKDGVVYSNAYAPVPVCAPTRSAIITGMYPTTLGTHNMRTYKANRSDNQPEIGIPSYSPIVPDGTVMFTQLLRENGYYCTNNHKEDYNFKKLESAWDESSRTAHWRNRTAEKPFFSVFNFTICHESGIWKQADSTLYVSTDDVPVPPYFPDDSIVRHDLAVNYSNLKRMDDQVGKIIEQLKADGLYEQSIIFFYGDHGGPFPRHKRALYETGTRVPMIIKFQNNEKDNDYDDRFLSFIDLAPTLLSLAGIAPPKVMQGKALYGKYGDTKQRDYIFTTSDRFDGVIDRIRAVRSKRYKYIRNFNIEQANALPIKYRDHMPMMQRMDQRYKEGKLDSVQSLWYNSPKPREELYDLEKDPYELVNLATVKELNDTLVHLRTVLSDWIMETNDLGRIPEQELLNNWLVDGEQPKLAPLELTERNNEVILVSKKSDAVILWKRPGEIAWNTYKAPILNSEKFIAKVVRIGFRDSPLLEYNM
ncbi:MAG: sulfatase [Saonia sp.]